MQEVLKDGSKGEVKTADTLAELLPEIEKSLKKARSGPHQSIPSQASYSKKETQKTETIMSLNKSKGNMYPWVTHTWNPIRGECPHGCVYCFMKGRDVGPLRLDEKTLADNLGSGRTIFVGSSTDMWAEKVPDEWILRVLEKCSLHDNTYIFQSKDPGRFFYFPANFPARTILGTTLESNREYGQSGKGPPAWRRASWLSHLQLFKKMVSIEPIMAFDHEEFLDWLRQIKPAFVSIGADSKGHKLPEPTASELDNFVVALRCITEVKLKKNLDRLLLKRRSDGKENASMH